MNTSTALYTSETILARHTTATAAIIIRKCNDAGCVRIETRARHFIFFFFFDYIEYTFSMDSSV